MTTTLYSIDVGFKLEGLVNAYARHHTRVTGIRRVSLDKARCCCSSDVCRKVSWIFNGSRRSRMVSNNPIAERVEHAQNAV